ncbi:MAG: hypothetical protein JWO22_2519 [Frankiales bacterium]|nr:hypothetical protein [Frankiales bacterium]
MDTALRFRTRKAQRSVHSRGVGLVLVVAACSGGSPAPEVIAPPSPEKQVLQAGRGDVTLTAGTYYSPVDFVPALAITVPAGWTSAHRGDDAFDLGTDGVVVVLDTPTGDTVGPVLQAMKAKASHPVAVAGTLDGQPATGFDTTGGAGEILASPGGTLSLDYAAGQRVRVLGADVDGVPLLAVVLVRDGRQWPTKLPEAQALLAGVGPG